jgi:hypothetical protein
MDTLNTFKLFFLSTAVYKPHCYDSFNSINGMTMILDEHDSTLQWQRQRLLGYFDDFADGKLFKLLYVVETHFIKVSIFETKY